MFGKKNFDAFFDVSAEPVDLRIAGIPNPVFNSVSELEVVAKATNVFTPFKIKETRFDFIYLFYFSSLSLKHRIILLLKLKESKLLFISIFVSQFLFKISVW